jgi:hypothetical protein
MQAAPRTLIVLAMASLAALGQAGGGRGKNRPVPNYNTSSEATLNGIVEEVTEVDHAGFPGKGLHVLLKTDMGTLDLHIGPASFAAQEKLTLAKGDRLEVVGSKVKDNGADALIARTITKDGKTTTLRSTQGIPLWSGGARKGR